MTLAAADTYVRTRIHVHRMCPSFTLHVCAHCVGLGTMNVPVHLPSPPKPIDLDNILSLYGVHEKYLNNLVSRFDEKLIDNFFR